jgi:hypothetical protein
MQLSNSEEPEAPQAKTQLCGDPPPKLGLSLKFQLRRAYARQE